jgi:hypothetical protein
MKSQSGRMATSVAGLARSDLLQATGLHGFDRSWILLRSMISYSRIRPTNREVLREIVLNTGSPSSVLPPLQDTHSGIQSAVCTCEAIRIEVNVASHLFGPTPKTCALRPFAIRRPAFLLYATLLLPFLTNLGRGSEGRVVISHNRSLVSHCRVVPCSRVFEQGRRGT